MAIEVIQRALMHARVKPSVIDMSWYRSAMRAVVVSRSPRVAGNERGALTVTWPTVLIQMI